MKKLVAFFTVLLLAGTVTAQRTEVPSIVKNRFAALYPDVKKVEWEQEGVNYEAEFELNKTETSVVFDAQGNLLATETEIAPEALPQAAKDYLAKTVPGKKITEATKITGADELVTYEAEAGGKDYVFDVNGNFIGMEGDNKDDGKDD